MWTHARHIGDVHLWLIFHFFESTCNIVIIYPEQPSTLPNIYYDNGFHENNIPMTRFWYAKTTQRPPKNSIILNYNLGVRRKIPFNSSLLLFYRFDLLNYRKSYLHAYWWHHCSTYFFSPIFFRKRNVLHFSEDFIFQILNRKIRWNYSKKSQNGCWMDKFSTFSKIKKLVCHTVSKFDWVFFRRCCVCSAYFSSFIPSRCASEWLRFPPLYHFVLTYILPISVTHRF